MSFTAIEFIVVFLPVVVSVFYLLPKPVRPGWLLVASIYFYAKADGPHLPILLGSILFNFCVSYVISRFPEKRKPAALFGITANVLTLCILKYSNFFVRSFGVDWTIQITFPLGISFFTIQQIMFLMDRYEGLLEHPPVREYFLFGSFFPYVSMGPIVRWKQVASLSIETDAWQKVAGGLLLFVVGLAKKVLIADRLGNWADAGFSATSLNAAAAWLSSLAYSMQLYYDFSGYVDMALGSAAMLGFSLPPNFERPYLAVSIIDFWKRWHITLSRFITTYLFTPFARIGGKITFGKAMIATMAAMTIAGLWHGPSWNYVIFGALHGLALVLNNWWRKRKLKIPKALGWLLTLLFVNLAFVFFRAETVGRAGEIITSMAGLTHVGAPGFAAVFHDLNTAAFALASIVAILAIRFEPNLELIFQFLKNLRAQRSENTARFAELAMGCGAACLLALCIKYSQKPHFLYFQF